MTDRKDLRVREKEHTWIGGETMAFRVGENLSTFHVHKDLLEKRGIDLVSFSQCNWRREDHAAAFKLYVQYIYSGSIPSKAVGDSGDDRFQEMHKLLGLYFLAKTFGDIGAMDAVVSALLALSLEPTCDGGAGILPGRNEISYIYKHTNQGSPLRRLIVDLYVWARKTTPTTMLFKHFQDSDETPKQFFLDISKAAMDKYVVPQEKLEMPHGMDQVSCCDYHQHKKDAPCSSKKRKREDNDEDSRDPRPTQPGT